MKKLLLILLCVTFFYACKSDNRNALKIETRKIEYEEKCEILNHLGICDLNEDTYQSKISRLDTVKELYTEFVDCNYCDLYSYGSEMFIFTGSHSHCGSGGCLGYLIKRNGRNYSIIDEFEFGFFNIENDSLFLTKKFTSLCRHHIYATYNIIIDNEEFVENMLYEYNHYDFEDTSFCPYEKSSFFIKNTIGYK